MINQVDDRLLTEPFGYLYVPNFARDSAFGGRDQTPPKIIRSVKLSLVIPTYNEAKNIKNVIALLNSLLAQAIPEDYELIVVDDNSPDYTWEVTQALLSVYPQLKVMRRQGEKGLSSAVIRGWQAARGEILGVIDADLQHPPEVLLKLLAAIEQGADLAVASRHTEGGGVSKWSLTRRFLSRGAQILGLLILPKVIGRVSDPMSGYFLIHRQAIAGPILSPVGYKILLEVLGRGRVESITEIGYVFRERQKGESKVTWKQYIEYLLHLIKLRFQGRIAPFNQSFKFPLDRFIRFALVGLSGVFVDMSLFYLLSDPITLALGLTRSKIFAAEAAILNNFFWNDNWTFADISNRQNKWSQRIKRLLKFNLICLTGLIVNVILLNLLFNFLDINRYVANLVSILITTIWNFWMNLKLSWRVSDPN